MSYLDPVRLHFSGRFRADVSTVNNDVVHYDIRRFDQAYHKEGPYTRLGLWNPAGTGAWRLSECGVTRACYADGSFSEDPLNDSAVKAKMTDAGDRPSAKIVDLDPQQQGVSQIWGLQFRLLDPNSDAFLLKAEYRAAPFQQMWGRLTGQSGDTAFSAAFQSVLHSLEWGDLSGSPVLQALKAASEQGQLSIKFQLDLYAMAGPTKTYGRIVGTIGPYRSGEPEQFVLGRHLVPNNTDNVPMSHSVCVVDTQRKKVIADFGNALHTFETGLQDIGALRLGVASDAGIIALGDSSYRDADWYSKTAGIEEFPKTTSLTDEQLDLVEKFPLVVFAQDAAAAPQVQSQESPGELYLRPDGNVFRIDDGASATTRLFLTRRGRPVADTEITCVSYNNALDQSGDSPLVGDPPGAISFPSTVQTDAKGAATLTIKNAGLGPNPPRRYIDGQLYGIGFVVSDAAQQQIATGTQLEGDNFISVLLFGSGAVPAEPTWTNVRPILQQYANLYPRPHGPRNYIGRDSLHSIFDLGRYEDVVRYRDYIAAALRKPIEDAGAMPVTRDLAAWKRAMIVKWLTTPGADGLPKRDIEKVVDEEASLTLGAEVDEAMNPGGKTLAAMRVAAARTETGMTIKPRKD